MSHSPILSRSIIWPLTCANSALISPGTSRSTSIRSTSCSCIEVALKKTLTTFRGIGLDEEVIVTPGENIQI